MRIWITLMLSVGGLVPAAGAAAQYGPVTREQAVAAALAHVPQLALARGDTAAARAQLGIARLYPNPTVSASYSKDIPRYHATLAFPIDYPWVRGPRIGAATAARAAALYRLAFVEASVRFDAETTYARALVTAAHALLSRDNAVEADSLLHMAQRRRDAGDASDLDVKLATINAGQMENVAADDSLTSVLALLDLQRLMGLSADSVTISLADTLAIPTTVELASAGVPATQASLPVRAARADLEAAERTLAVERHSVLGVPALTLGFDTGDPTGAEPGLLPTFGISLPLPLFDQNRAAIALAAANRDRARAELAIADRDAAIAVSRAYRDRTIAVAKAIRDRLLLESAQQVARMSLAAYAEGAEGLPAVLEAQRNARTALLQYVDDVAAAQTADASVRLYTATSSAP